MGLSIDFCARLGAKSVGGPFGWDGLTLWPGMSRKAVRRHSLHGPEQHGCDWINRQRAGAYAAGQIWRLAESARRRPEKGVAYELAVIDRPNDSLAARPAGLVQFGQNAEG